LKKNAFKVQHSVLFVQETITMKITIASPIVWVWTKHLHLSLTSVKKSTNVDLYLYKKDLIHILNYSRILNTHIRMYVYYILDWGKSFFVFKKIFLTNYIANILLSMFISIIFIRLIISIHKSSYLKHLYVFVKLSMRKWNN